MTWLYHRIARPLLFRQESESVHNLVLGGLAWAGRSKVALQAIAAIQATPSLPVEAFGLSFPNPLGLAAGMDKQAAAVPVWEAMGFGFCELGGVTRHPQSGNEKPRMFRAIPDEALINRMGLNNPGATALARRLTEWRKAGRWPQHPVGINIGKSKTSALEEARIDYGFSFRQLWGLADFFVVNVSSPNTPNLRKLQDRAALEEIVLELESINRSEASGGGKRPLAPLKPILVKVSPDLSFSALDDIVSLVESTKLAGLVATNTTVSRPTPADPALTGVYGEIGGLSGRPLRQKSTEMIRHLHRQLRGKVPIIGVGGIMTVDDAWEKVAAGASLLQIYSGLVYHGPGIVPDIVRGLKERLSGASWREVVGSDNKL